MDTRAPLISPRRAELLQRSYEYVLEHGLSGMSLRPLASAIGTSPRVLLFLFGSKDELVRALLSQARADELELLSRMPGERDGELEAAASQLWRWLSAEEHRGLLRLWVESYARSLVEPDGPWAGFGRATVEDWLALLAAAQSLPERRSPVGEARRTLVLALLRGALLDLLATGDLERTTRAVSRGLTGVRSA